MKTFPSNEYERIVRRVAGESFNRAVALPTAQVPSCGSIFRSLGSYHGWREVQLAEMAGELNAPVALRRTRAIAAALHAAAASLPSHQAMARRRATRARLASVVDPLASREAGWVLARQAERRAERVEAAARRRRDRAASALLPYYRAAGFREAVESSWVDRDTGHCVAVFVGEPSCETEAETVWHSKKTRSGTLSTHRITVPATWARRVASRGIALVDGCLTLDAKAIPRRKRGELAEAYEAMWCRQGRGTSLVEERGVIGRLSPAHPWVHGQTVAQVARTSRRRGAAHADEQRAEARRAAIERGDWAAAWPGVDLDGVEVSWADSARAGNCETGSRGWVARHLPEYADADAAPATAVLRAAQQDRTETRRMAVAAVHRAVVRSRIRRVA
jgi:hypothetical protein